MVGKTRVIIQIDPSLLQIKAQKIQEIGGDISLLAKEVLSLGQKAPSYDGQFGSKVANIANEAGTRGETLASELSNLGERLDLKRIEFENVDNAAISGFDNVTSKTIGWLDSILSSKEHSDLLVFMQRYLSLGNFINANKTDLTLGAMIIAIFGTDRKWNGWTFFGIEQPSWWPSWLPSISTKTEDITFNITNEKRATPKTTFGDLIKKENTIASSSAQANKSNSQVSIPDTTDYDTFYDVPIEAQGISNLNHGCSPTSVSMVLNYYHAQNSSNAGATTEQLLVPLNAGGNNIALTAMTNEIKGLGYQNISVKVGASMNDLQSSLKNGPVIVTTGVKLVGSSTVSRAIDGSGSTIHAMVVIGYGKDTVVVNDPWSGQQLPLSTSTFLQMWNKGSDGMYVIRPN